MIKKSLMSLIKNALLEYVRSISEEDVQRGLEHCARKMEVSGSETGAFLSFLLRSCAGDSVPLKFIQGNIQDLLCSIVERIPEDRVQALLADWEEES